MDAVKFIEERNRMCKSFDVGCKGCPAFNGREDNLHCDVVQGSMLDDIAQFSIVEKWSKENPRKTRQDVFLEQYPEAQLTKDGVISTCPMRISSAYRDEKGCCAAVARECSDCCREFWMQEVE